MTHKINIVLVDQPLSKRMGTRALIPGHPCSWARIFRRLFSKRCTFGSKSDTKSLVRRYQAKFAKTVSQHLKVCHIWLIKFNKKTNWIKPLEAG